MISTFIASATSNFRREFRRARLVSRLALNKQRRRILAEEIQEARDELYMLYGEEAVIKHELGTM